MPRKKMIETDGRAEEQSYQPTLLEQVWGDDTASRYGTLDEVAYSKRLDSMTRSDLESHARLMGVVVVEHTPRLRQKLFDEFRQYVNLVRKPANISKTPTNPSDAALRVLAEGK